MKKHTKPRVALVNMPFGLVDNPSIQIGLLKSVLKNACYKTDDFYLNLDFAKEVGPDTYRNAISFIRILAGDWIFSGAAFNKKDSPAYLKNTKSFIKYWFNTVVKYENLKKDLLLMRKKADPWLDKVIKSFNWKDYDVIGFSCTYGQTVSSIALASRIKKLFPGIKIIFGGSAFEGSAAEEIAKHIDSVDCIIQGDGENAILEILHLIQSSTILPGVYRSQKLIDLNKLPLPDYETFFQITRKDPDLMLREKRGFTQIPVETSRGCWWAQKMQCLFCGINLSNINFRKKKSSRIIREVDALSKKYNLRRFCLTDTILDENHYRDLLPKLSSKKTKFDFFSEVRSNISYDKMLRLVKAGFTSLQPGIESLNTNILKKMRKGVYAYQNIEALKWIQYFKKGISWNILFNIPGENQSDYEEMIALIPKIKHFPPPASAIPVRLEGFSPMIRERGLIKNVKPILQYGLCYPKSWDIEKIAYFYTCDFDNSVKKQTYRKLINSVKDWNNSWSQKNRLFPELALNNRFTSSYIKDTRNGKNKFFKLNPKQAKIINTLEKTSLNFRRLINKTGFNTTSLKRELSFLIKKEIIIEMDGRYICLAINS